MTVIATSSTRKTLSLKAVGFLNELSLKSKVKKKQPDVSFFLFIDLERWCVWVLRLELTSSPYLQWVIFFVHCIKFLISLFWFWALRDGFDGFPIITCGNSLNTDIMSWVWYSFLLYAKHPLGQNGYWIRFVLWTCLKFCRVKRLACALK